MQHEHRDDPRVALGDERGDDRLALLAGGGAQHGVHRARGRGVVDVRERADGRLHDARIAARAAAAAGTGRSPARAISPSSSAALRRVYH